MAGLNRSPGSSHTSAATTPRPALWLWPLLGLGTMALIGVLALRFGSPAPWPWAPADATPRLQMNTVLDDMTLGLALAPARPGYNTATVILADSDGHPIDDAERVDVRFSYLDVQQGTQILVAQPQGQGEYVAQGNAITANGRWQAEVLVRRPAFGDVRTAFRFVITPDGVAAALPAGAVALGAALEVQNPVPASPESIRRGEQIYRIECQLCHGPRGRGDGPAGATLRPKPADFRVHLADGHTDGELFFWISEGVAETAMPGFKDRLSEIDRWHVLNYIKLFAPSK